MTNRIKMLCEGEDHWKDELHGGKADKKKPADFDAEQLKVGTKEEMEHTDSKHKAEEIAMDHLIQDPDYYKKLSKVENESPSEKFDSVQESPWFDLACVMEGLEEAPVNWKQSFSKLAKADKKKGSPLKAGNQSKSQYHVAKTPKAPQGPTPIKQAGAAEGDPLKTASNAEFFETDAGNYFVYRGFNKRYYAMYVSADMKKVTNLGEHGERREAIDAVLEHHDKAAAGLGEASEVTSQQQS